MMPDPAITIDALALILGVLSALAGLVYWIYRRVTKVATEGHVETEIEEELDPIETMAEEAKKTAEQNNEELQELKDLIEGGNSRFEQGLMDYLDENIEKTRKVRQDLDEISQEIERLKRERDEAQSED
jgi:uncharacterized protein HemX